MSLFIYLFIHFAFYVNSIIYSYVQLKEYHDDNGNAKNVFLFQFVLKVYRVVLGAWNGIVIQQSKLVLSLLSYKNF